MGADRILASDASARRFLGASVASGLLAAALTVSVALLIAKAIADTFQGGKTLDAILPALIVAALLALARSALMTAQELLAQRSSSKLRESVRVSLAQHILALGPTWLAGERAGEVVSAVTGGLESLDAWIVTYQPTRLLAALVPGLVLAVILILDAPTALVLILTGPVLILLLAIIGGHAQAVTARRHEEMRWMSAFFLDMLRGIETLKAYGRSRDQAGNIRDVSQHYGESTMDVLRTAFQTALVLEWATAVATAVVAVEVSLRLIAGGLAFEVAIAVLIVTPEFFAPLRQLAIRYHAGSAGRAGAERILTILDTPRPDASATAPPQSSSVDPIGSPDDSSDGVLADQASIRLEAVWFSYPDRLPALRGVDMEITGSRVTALVGSSGAGKTTVANLLLRFIEPERGSITVGGVPLRSADRSRWLQDVAWVPQRPHLMYGTVAEVIRVSRPDASDDDVVRAAQAANADAFITGLSAGYDTHLGEDGRRLSGGQRQRLAIARAFLKDAPLVVLDEPTSQLDAESEAAIGGALRRLVRDRTVLVISHRLRLTALADEVVVLDAGRVVRSGPPSIVLEPSGPSAMAISTDPGIA